MRALWSCFCVLLRLWWPSWMNNRQRSRKLAPNSSAGSRKITLRWGIVWAPCSMKGMHEISGFALLMKFLVAVKSIKRWDYISEKVQGTRRITFSRQASHKSHFTSFIHYHFLFKCHTVRHLSLHDLLFMIISSDNVFQPSEHTVQTKKILSKSKRSSLWMQFNITN